MRTRATLQRSGASRRVPARSVERPRRTETGSSTIAHLDGERRHDEVEPTSHPEHELFDRVEPVPRLASSLEPSFEVPLAEDVVDRQIGQLPGLVEPAERPFGPFVAPPGGRSGSRPACCAWATGTAPRPTVPAESRPRGRQPGATGSNARGRRQGPRRTARSAAARSTRASRQCGSPYSVRDRVSSDKTCTGRCMCVLCSSKRQLSASLAIRHDPPA